VVAILCGEIAACSFCIHSFSCRVQATPALTSRVLMLHIEYTGRSLFVRPCAPYTNRRTSVSLCFCDPLRASQSLSEPLSHPLKLRSRTARQTCIRITRSRLLQLLREAQSCTRPPLSILVRKRSDRERIIQRRGQASYRHRSSRARARREPQGSARVRLSAPGQNGMMSVRLTV
jgi:hypothetical protein